MCYKEIFLCRSEESFFLHESCRGLYEERQGVRVKYERKYVAYIMVFVAIWRENHGL